MKPAAIGRRTLIRRRTLKRRDQRGFALLMIFLMASAVALMLYMQVPRQAFESERVEEQMLIDRGEQYKRAVYLYYVSNNRQWPTRIEDLENTNNHRYLRQRYKDPYTGKDEWRLIHTNGAFLTDSLVTPPPTQGAPGVQGGALAGTGGATTQGFQSPGFTVTQPSFAAQNGQNPADPNAPPQVNEQVQRRASDNTMVSTSSYQNIAGNAPAPNNANNGDSGYQPFNAASLPPISLYPNGYNAPPATGQPGANPAGNNPGVNNPAGINALAANQLNQLGLNQPGAANPNQSALNPSGVNPAGQSPINLPGTNFPMNNPGLSAPNPVNANLGIPNFGGSTPGQPTPVSSLNQGFNVPGSAAPGGPTGALAPAGGGLPPGGGLPGASSQAVNLINQLLTQPRQAPQGIGANQQTTGTGGIAGVASTHKGSTIKSYGDRTKYQEWEFVFQLNQLGASQLQPPGQGPNGSGGIPTSNPGTPGAPGGAAGATGATGMGAPAIGAPGTGPGATGAANGAQPSPLFSTN